MSSSRRLRHWSVRGRFSGWSGAPRRIGSLSRQRMMLARRSWRGARGPPRSIRSGGRQSLGPSRGCRVCCIIANMRYKLAISVWVNLFVVSCRCRSSLCTVVASKSKIPMLGISEQPHKRFFRLNFPVRAWPNPCRNQSRAFYLRFTLQ